MAHRLRGAYKLPRQSERTSSRTHTQRPSLLSVPSTLQRGPRTQQIQIRLLTTPPAQKQENASAKQTAAFRSLSLTWPHKGWKDDVLLEVVASHRKPRTLGDKVAWRGIRICRWAMDFVTGMGPEPKVDKKGPGTAVTAYKPMTESQWMIRFIFLETLAGIPGIVAGTLRHLHSIRRFQPDQGWIKTLLEESYNERMHLLTFLDMYKPGWLMRFMVFAAQGVFYNTMFLSYLVSPRVCHRFVGYLEEEAVHTYTRCLEELDKGLLPGWTDPDFKIPEIAVKYWNIPEGKRDMRTLVLYIRADEASHRGVNHTLGNLDQASDRNPFIDEDSAVSHMQLAAIKPAGLEREEVVGR